jgi:uncharacterized protein
MSGQFRVVIDALYGSFKLDSFLYELICQPEVQRLREVRLSNINSLLLPGSSNISRFEHSLGTAHLASIVVSEMSLPHDQRLNLVCAALLHDVTITPFGHLMEEAFHYADLPFDHETRLRQIFGGEVELGNIDVQVFEGKTVGFRRVLDKKEFKKHGANIQAVLSLKSGEGALGRLIKGSIDLDNIDNICRMAYHIGISFRRELPIELSKAFFIYNHELSFDSKKKGLIVEWLNLRETLYNILMTNPIDFAAKSMLVEAIRLGLVGSGEYPPLLTNNDWKLTDSELIYSLGQYKPAETLIRRLRTGDFFDLIALFWMDGDAFYQKNLRSSSSILNFRSLLATKLRCVPGDVLIYLIKDKRSRTITGITFRDRIRPQDIQSEIIGSESNRLLLGICSGKRALPTQQSQSICLEFVRQITDDQSIRVCRPEEHVLISTPRKLQGQMSLFQ